MFSPQSGTVISNATAPVTFLQLLPRQFLSPEIAADLEGGKGLQASTGHLSLFVGLTGEADELGIQASNFWVYPDTQITKNYEAFNSDLSLQTDFTAVFISFPSTKDPQWSSRYPGKSTCAVITEGGQYDAYVKWSQMK